MSQTDLERYTEACNYPGRIDPPEIERQLSAYLDALGVKRNIRQLKSGWHLGDEPD